MNAAQPQSTPPTAPAPGAVVPPPAQDASLLIQKELEDNSLYNWLRAVPTKLKSAKLGNPKILGAVLLLALAGGIWWWFARESKQTEAARWKELNNSSTAAELDKVTKDYPNSTQALIARRNRAEIMFGTDGTAKLTSGDTRAAAIESIEKAREEFLALAADFKKADDKTLWALCLRRAAEAEESLIGIPKPGFPKDGKLDWDEADDRGTVAQAVEYYREAAKAIGEKTGAGERFTALADQLNAKNTLQPEEKIASPHLIGMTIHQQIKPKKVESEPKAPDKLGTDPIPGLGTIPKAPDKPLDPNAPIPMGTGTEPKAPDKPLTPTTK